MLKRNKAQLDRIGRRYAPYVYLYSKRGYLPLTAIKYLDINNFDINLKDEDLKEINFRYLGQLRDYQENVVKQAVKQGYALIDSKTGTGKTHIIMGLINEIRKRTLIIVPTKKLLKQMEGDFLKYANYKVGTFYSEKKDLGSDIIITTKSSFTRQRKQYDQSWFKNKRLQPPGNWIKVIGGPFHTIIIDEADTGISKDFINAITEAGANMIFGLTGTPERAELNTQDLELFYGPIIKGGDYLVRPSVLLQMEYRRDDEEEIKIRQEALDEGAWNYPLLVSLIENNEKRKEKVLEAISQIAKRRKFTIILCDRVQQVMDIYEGLRQKMNNVFYIHGEMKKKQEQETMDEINDLRKLNQRIVIVATIQKMGRGVDIPEIDTVILYAKVKIKPAVIQAIGRALRPAPLKEDVWIITFNESLLKNQMYQQRKAIMEEYKVNGELIRGEHFVFKNDTDICQVIKKVFEKLTGKKEIEKLTYTQKRLF